MLVVPKIVSDLVGTIVNVMTENMGEVRLLPKIKYIYILLVPCANLLLIIIVISMVVAFVAVVIVPYDE